MSKKMKIPEMPDVYDEDYIPTAFDWFLWNLSTCLDASSVDDTAKLKGLVLMVLTFSQEAMNEETEAERDAREALQEVARWFVDVVLRAGSGDAGSAGGLA